MKIAQISATFPPYFGGTGNVCYHNALELGKLGHEVTVITSLADVHSYRYPSEFRVINNEPFFQFGNVPISFKMMRLEGFDIIHLHLPFFINDFVIELMSKIRKIPYVVTYHQDVIHGGFKNIAACAYNSTIQSSVLYNARKIFVTSMDYGKNSKIKRIIQKREKDTVEIQNGVDLSIFKQDVHSDLIKKDLELEGRNIVLFVGALDTAHYFKGVDILLKSFKEIHSANTFLVIVGDGDLKQKYIQQSEESGVADSTLFTGRISNEELIKYYSIADLLVLPSVTMGEAFGMVLIEAMACSKAVIASNLPGVRSVVDNGINGMLVNPGDITDLSQKMRYLLDNKDIRDNFGVEGHKKVEKNYSWDKIAQKLEVVYNEVLE